jgi:hypothetical protein
MSSNEANTESQNHSAALLHKMFNEERQSLIQRVKWGWKIDTSQYNKFQAALRKDNVDTEQREED